MGLLRNRETTLKRGRKFWRENSSRQETGQRTTRNCRKSTTQSSPTKTSRRTSRSRRSWSLSSFSSSTDRRVLSRIKFILWWLRRGNSSSWKSSWRKSRSAASARLDLRNGPYCKTGTRSSPWLEREASPRSTKPLIFRSLNSLPVKSTSWTSPGKTLSKSTTLNMLWGRTRFSSNWTTLTSLATTTLSRLTLRLLPPF